MRELGFTPSIFQFDHPQHPRKRLQDALCYPILGKSPERLGGNMATCHWPSDLVPWVIMCPALCMSFEGPE